MNTRKLSKHYKTISKNSFEFVLNFKCFCVFNLQHLFLKVSFLAVLEKYSLKSAETSVVKARKEKKEREFC